MKKQSSEVSVRILLTCAMVAFVLVACHKNDDNEFDKLDILEKIKTLEGVSVTEIAPQNGYPREFQLDITQPVDHNNPNGPKFTQRAYLSHVDETMPMVFAPNGYRSGPKSSQEIAGILKTNCLHVTHRFFFDSRPDPLDWQYLTIKQAADDHHRIVTLFKKIYKGKWISSGGSKSGLTSLFHKRYYPYDVDATIAYVAPFTFGPKDARFPGYLSQIGESGCFEKLKNVQIYVLKHRAEILPLIEDYIEASGTTYSMDTELLLELNIMDYPFLFWQYYDFSCSSIPDTISSSTLEIFRHYTSIAPISSFSDNNIVYFEPYVYQAITELGAPAYQTDYLKPYLRKIDPDAPGNPNYELVAPKSVTFNFNYTTLAEIYSWLRTHSDNIIYIYGKNDPWSAGAIELTDNENTVFVMQEGENHNVKIVDLSDPEVVYNALEDWLDITINPTGRKSSVSYDEAVHFRLYDDN
jgi:hypothetical protein